MNKEHILTIYHDELRINARTPGFRREVTPHVIRHVSEYNDGGFILASQLDGKNAKSVIQGELEYFVTIGQPFEWKLYDYDQPTQLKQWLLEAGFKEDEEEALMVLMLQEGSPLVHKQSLSKMEEIKTSEGIEDIVSLLEDIWKGDHSDLGKRLWRDKQERPDSLYLYGIYHNNELVSGAWMYLEEGSSFASLWGGATRLPYRGKGYYKDLIAIRAQKAWEKGYKFLTVDARPMSRPILEKNNFQCLAYTYGMLSPI